MENQDLNLDELQLDLSNPRIEGLSSERAALEKIAVSQGDKLEQPQLGDPSVMESLT